MNAKVLEIMSNQIKAQRLTLESLTRNYNKLVDNFANENGFVQYEIFRGELKAIYYFSEDVALPISLLEYKSGKRYYFDTTKEFNEFAEFIAELNEFEDYIVRM